MAGCGHEDNLGTRIVSPDWSLVFLIHLVRGLEKISSVRLAATHWLRTKSNMQVILTGNYGTGMSDNTRTRASSICLDGEGQFTRPMVTRPTISCSWRVTHQWMRPQGARRGGDSLRSAYLGQYTKYALRRESPPLRAPWGRIHWCVTRHEHEIVGRVTIGLVNCPSPSKQMEEARVRVLSDIPVP